MSALPPAASLLQATIRQVALNVPQSDNLGQSDDWRDLYYNLDYLCFAVDRAYPEIPCAKGCSHCCHNQLFRVSEAEWQTVRQGLAAMPAETRAALLAKAREMYAAHRGTLEAMASYWSCGEALAPGLHESAPKSCPLLVEGRCSIYAHRPAICRGYGYFSATVSGDNALLICKQEGPAWIKHLEAAGVEEIPMPNWNPVQRQVEHLNQGRPIKPLPLWLLEEAEG